MFRKKKTPQVADGRPVPVKPGSGVAQASPPGQDMRAFAPAQSGQAAKRLAPQGVPQGMVPADARRMAQARMAQAQRPLSPAGAQGRPQGAPLQGPPQGRSPQGVPDQGVSASAEHFGGEIAVWLRKLKFRKKLFGGVDERDVWRRLDELNRMYEKAVVAERARCAAILEQHGIDPRRRQACPAPQSQASRTVQMPPVRRPD